MKINGIHACVLFAFIIYPFFLGFAFSLIVFINSVSHQQQHSSTAAADDPIGSLSESIALTLQLLAFSIILWPLLNAIRTRFSLLQTTGKIRIDWDVVTTLIILGHTIVFAILFIVSFDHIASQPTRIFGFIAFIGTIVVELLYLIYITFISFSQSRSPHSSPVDKHLRPPFSSFVSAVRR